MGSISCPGGKNYRDGEFLKAFFCFFVFARRSRPLILLRYYLYARIIITKFSLLCALMRYILALVILYMCFLFLWGGKVHHCAHTRVAFNFRLVYILFFAFNRKACNLPRNIRILYMRTSWHIFFAFNRKAAIFRETCVYYIIYEDELAPLSIKILICEKKKTFQGFGLSILLYFGLINDTALHNFSDYVNWC